MTSLALGFAFTALGLAFLAQAKKDDDPTGARNRKMAGGLMTFAGLVMLGVAAFSYVARSA